MTTEAVDRHVLTRRAILKHSVAAVAFPAIVPVSALARSGVAPSEKINLGVIGIGPRCTYDLSSMLGQPDVHCVAICDVQASRREPARSWWMRITATKIASSTVTIASCWPDTILTRS